MPLSRREAMKAQAAAAAAGKGPARPSRGPARVGRRMLGGIGGTGVTPGCHLIFPGHHVAQQLHTVELQS